MKRGGGGRPLFGSSLPFTLASVSSPFDADSEGAVEEGGDLLPLDGPVAVMGLGFSQDPGYLPPIASLPLMGIRHTEWAKGGLTNHDLPSRRV